MTKDQIYDTMAKAEQHHIRLVLADGTERTGYADVFETRYDNEGDPEPFGGVGSIFFYPDDGEPIGVYEFDIKEIEIVDSEAETSKAAS